MLSLHLTATKGYIIERIRQKGAASTLDGFKGTDEEAIAAVRADAREVFTVGACDNHDERGRCLGHEEEDTPST